MVKKIHIKEAMNIEKRYILDADARGFVLVTDIEYKVIKQPLRGVNGKVLKSETILTDNTLLYNAERLLWYARLNHEEIPRFMDDVEVSVNTNTNEIVLFWIIEENNRERTVGSLTFSIAMPLRYPTEDEYRHFGFGKGL